MAFVLPAVLAAGAIGSAVIGNQKASDDRNAATNARRDALAQYLALNVPDPKQQELILDKYDMTGQMDPALEQAINQGESAQGSISLDPSTRAAQESALSKLSDITSNNGMDSQERNQLQKNINAVNSNTKGANDAILQNAAARGVGGSGASLAAQLQAAQSGANTASENAMDAQAQASQRALQAISQQSSAAGSLHNQDYTQALNAANAKDAINQFNARNANAAMSANTAAKNQAQAYNVQEAQKIADQNTTLSNQQQAYNKSLIQQQYENELQKASGQANATNGVANQYNANAQGTANMWGGISGALGTAAGTVYKNNNKTTPPKSDDQSESDEE